MYDPGQCADSYCEWVELYNSGNETFDLQGCFFDGDNLSGNISANEYLVLVRNKDNFQKYFGGNNLVEISLSLVNKGKELKLNGNCSDIFDYSSFVSLAKGNNYTLERNNKGKWEKSLVDGGTPGKKNSVVNFNQDYSKLKITEVMVDPFGKDNEQKPLGEWIEVYNSGGKPINLGGLVLYDSEDDHELFISQSNFDKVVLGGGEYGVIYRNRDSDFDLSKTKDKVRLYTGYPLSNAVLIDQVSLSNSKEGMSWSKFGNNWYQTKPTPGKENIYTEKCDWMIDLELDNSIFQNKGLDFKVNVKRNFGVEENISVSGKIEDLFGKVVRSYTPWTNYRIVGSSSKSYSPNLKEGNYQLIFELSGLKCNDSEWENNQVRRLVSINPAYQKNDSKLEIERLYLGSDNSVEWGDQFQIKLNLYKGQNSKSTVEVYVEKDGEVISKRTKINLYDEYKNYPLVLPIQLIPNCNEKIEDGKGKLVLKGLGLEVGKEFEISGVDKEVCKDYLDYVKEDNKKKDKIRKQNAYQVLEFPRTLYSGEVYSVKVQLLGDADEHDFKVWSYLYKGNKCVSCFGGNRESNLIDFKLKEDEVKQIEMLIKVDEEVSMGEYRLKVKLNKDGLKTNRELMKSVYIKPKDKKKVINQSTSLFGISELNDKSVNERTSVDSRKEKIIHELPGIVVYESSSQKANNLIPYLLVGVFGLLSVLLGWKKL